MKKFGLFLLAVLMVAGTAGCSTDDDNADVVGTWAMTHDWGCDGSFGTWVAHIHSNKTFTTDLAGEGTWERDGEVITLNWGHGDVYTGTVAGDTMSGTMTAYRPYPGTPNTGCWSGTKTSSKP